MTSLKIGDEVSIPIDPVGVFWHRGVCVDIDWFTREPIVAHNSRRHGHGKEDRLSDFAGGKTVSVRTRHTNLTAAQIQIRSRQNLRKPYSLTSNNCEDFVSDVLDLNEGSGQRALWGGVIAVGLLYMAVRKSVA